MLAYKHPNTDVLDLNSLIDQINDKIAKEQKQIFFPGDFNINLLNKIPTYLSTLLKEARQIVIINTLILIGTKLKTLGEV